VNVAREALRARARRRWLLFFAPEELPDALEQPPLLAMLDGAADARRALHAIYGVLDTMSASGRTLFVLRRFEGWELAEMAAAFGVSLATIKRRIADAEKIFFARAERDPVLASWLGEGGDR